MEPIRILLVEDDPEDFMITRDLILDIQSEKQYVIDWASTYDEAIRILTERRHDVCLIDYNLGLHSGLDVVKNAYDHDRPLPFIFFTGQSDYEIDRLVMLAGATDFLVKGSVSPGDIERTIRYGIRHAKNLTEIRSLNATLEKRVEDRTQELEKTVQALKETNQTLQEVIREKEIAQQRALAALQKEISVNELKSRFITMASHEFRTPLTTILSSVQLLVHHVSEVPEEKTAKHFQRIKSNVALLTELLNDFLSLEKLEAGKMYSVPEAFDIGQLLEETVQEIQDSSKPGQCIRLIHHSGKPESVLLDKRHVKGILINLMSNAVKYSSENSVIRVETRSSPQQLVIDVIDQGIGIPSDEQKHLFELFFRARNAVNIKGTGLGLNIVKKYLNLMGGSIAFSSDPESGSVFTVTLPKQIKTVSGSV